MIEKEQCSQDTIAKLFRIETGEQFESAEDNFTTDYAEAICPQIITAFDELGLADRFQTILASHISDLHIAVETNDDNRSRLGQANDTSELGSPYKRLAIINKTEYQDKLDVMMNALDTVLGVVGRDCVQKEAGLAALDWIMFELSADAAGNSCRMQFICDKYISDYNGQSYDKAEETIAYEFLSDAVSSENLSESLQENEHANFRSGVAMYMLKGSLIRHSLVKNWKSAEWVAEKIKKDYQSLSGMEDVAPFDSYEIILRLAHLKPRPTRQLIASYEASLESIEYFLKYQDDGDIEI